NQAGVKQEGALVEEIPFPRASVRSAMPTIAASEHASRSRSFSSRNWIARLALGVIVAGIFAGAAMAGEDAAVLKKVEVVGVSDDSQTTGQTRGALITLEVNERPLKQVLDYLSTVSGVNIRVVKEKDNKLLVTFKLENVTYRAILDFIA